MQINKSDRNDAIGIARIYRPVGSRRCTSRISTATGQGATGQPGAAVKIKRDPRTMFAAF